MRRLGLVLAIVVFTLGAAGCGGGDDEAAEDTDTVGITETTTDETTTDLDTSGLEGFASEDCLQLISAGAALGQALASAGSGDAGAEQAAELFDELVDKAPDEIKGDIQTLARGYAAYAAAVEDLDLQAGQVPSAEDLQAIQQALASIDQPELTAAGERLSAWAEENCPGG